MARKNSNNTRNKSITFEQACKVLGIAETASYETGLEATQKLRSEYHPDKHAEATEAEKAKLTQLVQLVNSAWSLLKTALKKQADLDSAAEKAKQAKQKKQAEQNSSKSKTGKIEFANDGLSVSLVGNFTPLDLINCLYDIAGSYLEELQDVVKDNKGMVAFFRALSTGRKNRVFSLALLDSKNRIIRTEELVVENPDIRVVATQALFHGARKVYLVCNSLDGSVPKSLTPAMKAKYQSLVEGLPLLGLEFVDLLVIGHDGYYSAKESQTIGTGPTAGKSEETDKQSKAA